MHKVHDEKSSGNELKEQNSSRNEHDSPHRVSTLNPSNSFDPPPKRSANASNMPPTNSSLDGTTQTPKLPPRQNPNQNGSLHKDLNVSKPLPDGSINRGGMSSKSGATDASAPPPLPPKTTTTTSQNSVDSSSNHNKNIITQLEEKLSNLHTSTSSRLPPSFRESGEQPSKPSVAISGNQKQKAPPAVPPKPGNQGGPINQPFMPSHEDILPRYELVPPDYNSPGVAKFVKYVLQPEEELRQASLFVIQCLYPTLGRHKNVKKIRFILRDMEGVAYTSNQNMEVTYPDGRKESFWEAEFVFSTRYLNQIDERRFLAEVRGVIVHELTHAHQFSCPNGGLVE